MSCRVVELTSYGVDDFLGIKKEDSEEPSFFLYLVTFQ